MRSTPRSERGQVLPLFALFVIVLLGFAALAIDVSGALSARRFYRSVADGASLAGAQDLQQTGSRAVGSADRIRARHDAMTSVVTELGIAGGMGGLPGACSTSADADVLDTCVLTGTDYHVSIRAGIYTGQPAPIACSECDPARSVQVGLRNARFGLTFARLMGQTSWNVGVTSVAGLQWSKSYAVVTLRPPAKLGSTYDVKDIKLDGGTDVTVSNGDVATNADMVFTGSGTSLTVDPGFNMYYADWTGGQGWPSPPTGVKIFDYVRDANYVYPAMRGVLGSATCASGPANCAPTFAGDSTEAACLGPGVNPACTRADLDPTGCGAEATYLRTSVYSFMATQALGTIYCYKPGIYAPTRNPDLLVVKNGTVALFMPGAYYFKKNNGGLQIQNGARLLGGYRPGQAGVALMFDECNNQCVFNGTGAETIALNAGTKYPAGTTGIGALAAHDWNDQPVETTGPSAPTPHILMTLMVNKDTDGPGGTPGCTVPAYPAPEPNPCNASNNRTLNLAGGGSLNIEGVQYAPTDNIEIHGGSTGTGTVGQLWVWTIFYSGGTQINQEGAGSLGPGVLRLDSACTAPGTPCNP